MNRPNYVMATVSAIEPSDNGPQGFRDRSGCAVDLTLRGRASRSERPDGMIETATESEGGDFEVIGTATFWEPPR